PRVEAVLEALPGANCGGCGFAGCEGYATAVVNDPSVPANKCCAGGAAVSIAVGELTGKTVAEAEPLYALRRCDKLAGKVAPRYQYQGMPSCAAAALMRGGTDVCVYSCLGFGDCVQACPFGAMEVRDGLARVDRGKCTGCGACVAACPRGILELTPQRGRVAVYCNTRDKLRAVMDVCDVGCIKCGKCVKTCPARAVRLEDNRIVIDQLQCLSYGPSCGEVCVSGCPRHILRSTRKSDAPVEDAATPPAPAGGESPRPQSRA
ncbi:RnfABCDGE type electron transport complex subunit B, partial [uncultured Desulfovibrio sp.]